jgi:serine/threonine-protein kinase
MTLSPGTRLGAYDIVSLLGAGGMGEVYRARDTKLDRDVAIKVLPDLFAHDPERLARFEREAHVLASLNHSNIAHVYGFEESAGVRALVMELVEGPTLADRLARGPLPLDDAVPIARQIADALDAAHEQGIVHRDLKPANVKLRPDGVVKVLDFGLAKALDPTSSSSRDAANSPTMTARATQLGMILGTAAYMAPEQAKGKTVDKRADIWAFGAVLYEMLTGRRPFASDDVSETLAFVITREPDWRALPPSLPAPLGKLVRRCLDKDPKRRLRDIGEARIAIDEAVANPSAGASAAAATGDARVASAAATAGASWRRALPWALAFVLGVALAVALLPRWTPTPRSTAPLMRFDVDLGSDVAFGSSDGTDVVLSPDGTRIAYVSGGRLFTRRLDQPTSTELAGVGAYAPFFSPDNQWIAFFAAGKLQKVPVTGGAAIKLCDAINGRGGSWSEDVDIIAALTTTGGLSRVPSAGGSPVPVTDLGEKQQTHRWPQVLPGGKGVLFTAHTIATSFDTAVIEVMSFADRRRKALQHGAMFGRYLPSGHLVYLSRGTLFAVPFDLDRLEVRGAATPILEKVAYRVDTGAAQLDFARNGTLIYRTGGAGGGGLVTVQWLDSAGSMQPMLSKAGAYLYMRLAPDGTRLALTSAGDINVYDSRRDTMTPLTFGSGAAIQPTWTPDGRFIVFTEGARLTWTRSDGAGKPQPLTQSRLQQVPWSITADGTRLAYWEVDPKTGYDLWTLPLEQDAGGLRAGKPEPFLQTPADERHPAISPDGRWLAYSSSESGIYQVYVRAFPDTGGRFQISNDGGVYPVWSRNGRELFYRTENQSVMVASYTINGDSFVAEKPRLWSDTRLANIGLQKNFDLAPDGRRIAAFMPAESPEDRRAQNHVTVLLNYFDEVRRIAPATR